MNVLDLFSGIGGFSLGLERAGMRTVAFCEIDPYCQRVLRQHWPDVPVYDDVRTLTAARLMADAKTNGCGLQIDVICGGFPCQDVSIAGKGAGITGEHSGLWKEYARIIGEVRPSYAIIENVAALLSRGIGDVLFDLSALGYDAEWTCIRASDVGAPHRRDRVWIVAYADGAKWREIDRACGPAERICSLSQGQQGSGGSEPSGEDVADVRRQLQSQGCLGDIGRWLGDSGWWLVEPDVGRVAHGVPARVDRLRALGNAVIPQIPELIGRAIMTARAALDKDEGK